MKTPTNIFKPANIFKLTLPILGNMTGNEDKGSDEENPEENVVEEIVEEIDK